MENGKRHGEPTHELCDLLQEVTTLTEYGLDAIEEALSQKNLVITENSVIFVCNLEWKWARRMAKCLMGPDAIAKATKLVRNARKRTVLLYSCDRPLACEILSKNFQSDELVMLLNDADFQSMNVLPLIMPAEASISVAYIEDANSYKRL